MALRDAWTALLRREVKASRAGPLIALQHPGRAVWSPRRFDAFTPGECANYIKNSGYELN